MIVENQIKDILKTRKVHLTLIDPDEQSSEAAVQIAKAAISGGTDGIMLGGSTVDGDQIDATAKALSENIDLPIIIFPGNTSNISKYADAIFFMSFLNSNNPYWIMGAQALGAPAVKKAGIEAIPMGYMVVQPGGTVGWIGEAKLVPRNKPKIPAAYAIASEMLGMRFFYLEAGSGAEQHIPPEMVTYSKKATDNMVLVVGGGIRTKEAAYEIAKAGADIIVTGTIVEETIDVESKIAELVGAIRKASE
ncbi:heptaprenylglyceryl phosphate synthase [Methanobrevibacter cuticularis]|uniref:Geranylgeranylglyceryl phosphate synthase n=1 Tax=Methanobrevibacter cuticularis TaxID=47311 RepID=A0A166FBI9_9EURY|nr:geranylgeranylglyceryl/heptaprenylglyceryl phosphate synthase [Methanobrevibacter cuticularis]KZX17502.1 heptaprenylglyceryl phosphate synthase [Methanobrevibacter cuticularis]